MRECSILREKPTSHRGPGHSTFTDFLFVAVLYSLLYVAKITIARERHEAGGVVTSPHAKQAAAAVITTIHTSYMLEQVHKT